MNGCSCPPGECVCLDPLALDEPILVDEPGFDGEEPSS